MSALHPDYIDKGRKVDLILDGKWQHFDFRDGAAILPYVRPAFGTYLLSWALLGEVIETNHPDTDLNVKVTRWKPGPGGVLVYDAVDNGTAWDYIEMDRDHLVTRTWCGGRTPKVTVSSTYPGVGIAYRGEGGAAFVEQRLLKFVRQRDA